MVIVNKGLVPEAIEELGKKGCPFAIITASGYGETGAAGLEDQKNLVRLAQKYGMRLMGPNCMGLINLEGPIILSWCATLEREPGDLSGDVGLVCQSGALLGSIWDMVWGMGSATPPAVHGKQADLKPLISELLPWDGSRVITAFISPEKSKEVR
jgi:acyl-CoA synthetase (NDP forming)